MAQGGRATQASSASVATLMTALIFDLLRPQEPRSRSSRTHRRCSTPSNTCSAPDPRQARAVSRFARAPPNPTRREPRTARPSISPPDRFGLGVGMTLFASIAQDYLRLKRLMPTPDCPGRMIALAGVPSSMRATSSKRCSKAGSMTSAILWWVIDYNRQSLDAVVSDRLFGRIDALFEMMGWRVVPLKYGRLLEAAFARLDGIITQDRCCPKLALFGAGPIRGGEGFASISSATSTANPPVSARSSTPSTTAALHRLMTNLAGHDLASSSLQFHAVTDDRPTCSSLHDQGLRACPSPGTRTTMPG